MQQSLSQVSVVARRHGLVGWATTGFTHSVDLAPNLADSINAIILANMFKGFCFRLDRRALQCKHVHLRNSHERLRMLAFPEKLDTNPHLHCFADFSEAYLGEWLSPAWERILSDIWRSVAGSSATVVVKEQVDHGKAWYATKEALRRDHYVLHSWDFHRNDKVEKRPSATIIQRVPARRRARTH